MNNAIKILVLEHDVHDLALVLRELQKGSLPFIHQVADGEQSFTECLKRDTPDIILSDYSLPAFDGVAAFHIKQQHNPEIPFIIVSGTLGEEKAVELIKLGVTDYVIKDKLYMLNAKIIRALQEAHEKKEKALAQQRLIQSERRLADAQAIAHIGNWEVDQLTGECCWSDEAFVILGLKPGQVTPSLDLFLSCVHPDDRDFVKKTIYKNEELEKEFSFNNRIIRPDGELRHIFSACRFTFDENHKPVKLIGIIHDVTTAKRMEEELKASNKELETFIYRASHDLRGPLSSIIGLTRVSKTEITDKKSIAYFKMVEASAQKLDDTLISLVESMTIRDISITCEEVDCLQLINEVKTQLQFHEGFSKVNITVHSEVDKILSSKMILSSIFQNIIQNAIKYKNHKRNNSFLKISILNKDNATEITFEDNGIGIDDSFVDKIFGMYFRATTAGSGSGLGLYIVKIGVEKLGGTISLKSIKGDGTTFTIRLPDSCVC